MIKVNLLSTVPGAAPPREFIPKEHRSAFMGLGMLMLTAAGVGGYWYYLNRQHADIDSRITTAQAELERLKEAATLVDRATARKAELAERVSLIERLRTAKDAPVSLLETVNLSATDGLWLTEIKQTGAVVQIDGRSLSVSAITDFAEQLQNSGLFKKPVEIMSTVNDAMDEHAIVKFSLKAEAAPPQPVPAAPASNTTTVTSATPAGAPAAPATPPSGSGV